MFHRETAEAPQQEPPARPAQRTASGIRTRVGNRIRARIQAYIDSSENADVARAVLAQRAVAVSKTFKKGRKVRTIEGIRLRSPMTPRGFAKATAKTPQEYRAATALARFLDGGQSELWVLYLWSLALDEIQSLHRVEAALDGLSAAADGGARDLPEDQPPAPEREPHADELDQYPAWLRIFGAYMEGFDGEIFQLAQDTGEGMTLIRAYIDRDDDAIFEIASRVKGPKELLLQA